MNQPSIRELCRNTAMRIRKLHPGLDLPPLEPEPEESEFVRILRNMDEASEIESPYLLEILEKAGIRYVWDW